MTLLASVFARKKTLAGQDDLQESDEESFSEPIFKTYKERDQEEQTSDTSSTSIEMEPSSPPSAFEHSIDIAKNDDSQETQAKQQENNQEALKEGITPKVAEKSRIPREKGKESLVRADSRKNRRRNATREQGSMKVRSRSASREAMRRVRERQVKRAEAGDPLGSSRHTKDHGLSKSRHSAKERSPSSRKQERDQLRHSNHGQSLSASFHMSRSRDLGLSASMHTPKGHRSKVLSPGIRENGRRTSAPKTRPSLRGHRSQSCRVGLRSSSSKNASPFGSPIIATKGLREPRSRGTPRRRTTDRINTANDKSSGDGIDSAKDCSKIDKKGRRPLGAFEIFAQETSPPVLEDSSVAPPSLAPETTIGAAEDTNGKENNHVRDETDKEELKSSGRPNPPSLGRDTVHSLASAGGRLLSRSFSDRGLGLNTRTLDDPSDHGLAGIVTRKSKSEELGDGSSEDLADTALSQDQPRKISWQEARKARKFNMMDDDAHIDVAASAKTGGGPMGASFRHVLAKAKSAVNVFEVTNNTRSSTKKVAST